MAEHNTSDRPEFTPETPSPRTRSNEVNERYIPMKDDSNLGLKIANESHQPKNSDLRAVFDHVDK